MEPVTAASHRGAGPHGSAPDTVREALRVAISSGELAPGLQLRQDELAARFGTSRIPVREALRQHVTWLINSVAHIWGRQTYSEDSSARDNPLLALVTYGEGACEGVIAHEGRGDHGFGYDPLFLPVDTPGKTMAELTADEKNAISHRFHALEHLSAKLTGEE